MSNYTKNIRKATEILEKIKGNPFALERLIQSIVVLRPSAIVNAYKEEIIDEDAIIKYLKAGKKILAIKLYREQSDASLKEAVDYVNELATRV